MAKKIFIIDSETECTQSYNVELKQTSDSVFVPLPIQYSSPIVIDNLEDDTSYDVRITRKCCDGVNATPVVSTIVTTQVADPIDFITDGSPTSTVIDLEWDDDGTPPVPTDYILERGLNSDYSDAVVVYRGSTKSYSNTGLTTGTTYYFRVRALSTGYLASDFVTHSETTA